MRSFSGFSIVEFLIVLLISSFMLATLFKSFDIVKRHFNYYSKQIIFNQEKLLLSKYIYEMAEKAGFCNLAPLSKLSIVNAPSEKTISSYRIFDKSTQDIPNAIKQRLKPGTQGLEISYLDYLSRLSSDINSRYRIQVSEAISAKKNQRLAICNDKNMEFISISKDLRKQHVLYTDSSITGNFLAGDVIGLFKQVFIYIRQSSKSEALYWSYTSGARGEISNRWQSMTVIKVSGAPYPLLRITFSNLNQQQFEMDVSLLNEKSS